MISRRKCASIVLVSALLCLALSCATSYRPPCPRDFSYALSHATEFKLDNGMNILVVEKEDVPVVTFMQCYRAGAVNDPEGLSGMSHFLEHMMFKGTKDYAKGEIDLLSMRAGGSNNAFTTKEYTGFHFSLPADTWELAPTIEASRMTALSLDPKEFEAERGVVMNERKGDLDSPDIFIGEKLDEVMYAEHPHHRPIIGYEEDLAKNSREAMMEFYRRNYVPANATVVIAGDVDADEAGRVMNTIFGEIPAGSPQSQKFEPEPPQTGERRENCDVGFTIPRVVIGYHSAELGSRGDFALDLLSNILSNGRSSRLQCKLIQEKQLVCDVGTYNSAGIYASSFGIEAELLPGTEMAEVDDLVKNGPSDAEMRKARNQISAGFCIGKQSTESIADSLAYYRTVGQPDYIEKYLSRIAAVTAEDVRWAVQTYLRPENRSVVWSVPAEEDGKSENGWLGRRPLDRAARAFPAAAARRFKSGDTQRGGHGVTLPPVRRFELDNGMVVLVVERHFLPIVRIRAYVNADRSFEPEGKSGLAALTGMMLSEGTQKRKSEALLEEIESLGAIFGTSATGVAIEALSKDFGQAADIVADVLRNSAFDEAALEKSRKLLTGQILSNKEDPDTTAYDMFRAEICAGHPYAFPHTGTMESIGNITRGDVEGFHGRFFHPNNTILVVAGDVTSDEALAVVHGKFRDWPRAAVDFPKVPELSRQTAPKTRKLNMDCEQTYIYVGHLGITRGDPDFCALQVMDSILGYGSGFTDRISKRLRDEEGLAYIVGGSATFGADVQPGMLMLYGSPDTGIADSAGRTIRGLVEEARRIRDFPVTDGELADAKAYLTGSYVFRFETLAGLAEYMIDCERFGLRADYAQRRIEMINGITKDDVQRVAKKHIDPDNLTTVVVGPAEAKEEPAK
jgi:zinc protease